MSNQDAKIKEITYHGTKQYFTEVDARTKDVIKDSSFRTSAKHEKVIQNNNATIVILEDGSKGVSKCLPIDTYNETKGIKIAYIRAKIKSLNKELKELIKL